LRDFVAAVEVGAATAGKMLDDVEHRLLEIMSAVDKDVAP
jgi:hypothetical protein